MSTKKLIPRINEYVPRRRISTASYALPSEVASSSRGQVYKHVNPLKAGTNLSNRFVPIYSIGGREELSDENSYLFYKPQNKYASAGVNTYDDLLYKLVDPNMYFHVYAFKSGGISQRAYVGTGYMADANTDDILLCLCSDGYDEKNYDISKMRLYLSNEFVNGDVYKNVYKRVNSEYIVPLQEEGVEVIIKSAVAIDNELFNAVPSPKFESIDKLDEFYSEMQELLATPYPSMKFHVYNGYDYSYSKLIPYGYTWKNIGIDFETSYLYCTEEDAEKFLLALMRNNSFKLSNYSDENYTFPEIIEKVYAKKNVRSVIFYGAGYSFDWNLAEHTLITYLGNIGDIKFKVNYFNNFDVLKEKYGDGFNDLNEAISSIEEIEEENEEVEENAVF